VQLLGNDALGGRLKLSNWSPTQLFSHAISLGSTHSLIEHRASVEGANTRSPENLLRLSIGLEHPDDLIEDLKEALEKF
jgi:cystathionine gamma-synthase